MVPDNRGRAERDHKTGLLEPPAKIDVIARFTIFGIEAAHALKRPTMERHVTTRNVFGDRVGEQNMAGTARRRCDASLNPVLCRRRNVRSANSRVVAADKGGD